MMKCIPRALLVFSFLLTALNSKASEEEFTPKIHIFYGNLQKGQVRILDRVFRPKIQEILQVENLAKVEEHFEYDVNTVSSAMANPSTLGVLFLGHPAIKVKEEGDKKTIVNGFLQDPNKRYFPKNLLQSAHANLVFASLVTCHSSGFLGKYLKFSPEGLNVIKPPSFSAQLDPNPIFELTSFYDTPKVLEEVKQLIPETKILEFKENLASLEKQRDYKLEITTRDLMSKHFGYTVVVNDKLIGTLYSKRSKYGRPYNKVKNVFQFSLSSKVTSLNIQIMPDDPKRPKPQNIMVIDDILVDSIKILNGVESQELLEKSIHLGDQDGVPDTVIRHFFKRNQKDFEGTQALPMLEVKYDL